MTDDFLDEMMRSKRDALLSDSDWTQLPDVPLTNRAEWAAYRQELRDLTNDPDWPDVTFPERPE